MSLCLGCSSCSCKPPLSPPGPGWIGRRPSWWERPISSTSNERESSSFLWQLHLDAAAPRPRREEIPKAKTEYFRFHLNQHAHKTELWRMVNWEKVIMMVSLLTWSPQSWFFHRHHDQGRQIWYRCHPELDPFTTPPHADHQFLSIIVPMLLLMKTSLYPYIQGEDHLKNTLYVWAPLPDPCYNIAAFIQIVSIMIVFFF